MIKKLSKKQLCLLIIIVLAVGTGLTNYTIQYYKKQVALEYKEKGKKLIQAVKYGTLEQVKEAIADGADINYIENQRFAAIVSATLRGDLSIVKWLVENGADIHRTFGTFDLVIFAVKQPNIEVLKYLLEQNITVNVTNLIRVNPLSMSIQQQRLDYIKLLFAHGYDIKKEYYPALYSVELPDSQITQYLLSQGLNKDIKFSENSNLLIAAASAGSLANVQLLVNEGIAVDEADDYGLTPLIVAAATGHTDIVDYLIQQGASVNRQTSYGNTPLIAATNQDDLNAVRLLLAAGAKVDITNREGMTALAFAIDGKHYAIKALLLAQGASLETALSALDKQHQYVANNYPPKVKESYQKYYPKDWKPFDPSQCKNPKDPFVYYAENRAVIRTKNSDYYSDFWLGESYQAAPLPTPIDDSAPAGCYENPKQTTNFFSSDYEPNFSYGEGSSPNTVIYLTAEEKNKRCEYVPFSTLRCYTNPSSSQYAYRVDRAIYNLPMNQPFVIGCEEPGFSNTKCFVVYKRGRDRFYYIVNPDNRRYFFNTPAQTIKEIIKEDKEIQSRREARLIRNYPWRD